MKEWQNLQYSYIIARVTEVSSGFVNFFQKILLAASNSRPQTVRSQGCI
jgi:hypothetical protein